MSDLSIGAPGPAGPYQPRPVPIGVTRQGQPTMYGTIPPDLGSPGPMPMGTPIYVPPSDARFAPPGSAGTNFLVAPTSGAPIPTGVGPEGIPPPTYGVPVGGHVQPGEAFHYGPSGRRRRWR